MSSVIPMPPRNSVAMSTGLRVLIELSKPTSYGGSSSEDPGFKITALPTATPDQAEEARRVLPGWERAMADGVSRDRLRHWLIGLNASVGKMVNEEEFAIRFEAIFTDFADFPAMVFSPESLSAAKRACPDFFPGVGKLFKVIDPFRREAEHNLATLRRIAEPRRQPDPEPDYVEPSPEAKQAIRAKFRADMTKVRAEIEAAKPKVNGLIGAIGQKPKEGLSDHVLIGLWRRQLSQEANSQTAATIRRRIELLEQKLATAGKG